MKKRLLAAICSSVLAFSSLFGCVSAAPLSFEDAIQNILSQHSEENKFATMVLEGRMPFKDDVDVYCGILNCAPEQICEYLGLPNQDLKITSQNTGGVGEITNQEVINRFRHLLEMAKWIVKYSVRP